MRCFLKTCLLSFPDLCCFQASGSPLSSQPRGTSLCRPLTSPVPWKCKSRLALCIRALGDKARAPWRWETNPPGALLCCAPRGDSTRYSFPLKYPLVLLEWLQPCLGSCSCLQRCLPKRSIFGSSAHLRDRKRCWQLSLQSWQRWGDASRLRAECTTHTAASCGFPHPGLTLNLAPQHCLLPSIASSELQAASSGCGWRFREAAAPWPSTARASLHIWCRFGLTSPLVSVPPNAMHKDVPKATCFSPKAALPSFLLFPQFSQFCSLSLLLTAVPALRTSHPTTTQGCDALSQRALSILTAIPHCAFEALLDPKHRCNMCTSHVSQPTLQSLSY